MKPSYVKRSRRFPSKPRDEASRTTGVAAARMDRGTRINKFLADGAIASRRKAEDLIRENRVRINGKAVKGLGQRVKLNDLVTVDGNPVSAYRKSTYFLLNKPKDCITTTNDEKDRSTVLDIVKCSERIYPVGRLDRDTTGVLLLTNDGDLTHRLTHPKYEIERVYVAYLDKRLQIDDAKRIANGIELEDGPTQPCEIEIDGDDHHRVAITLREGRNREVRRLFAAAGYEVEKLDRKFFAGLSHKGLRKGEYRQLTRFEIVALKKLVGLL